MKYGLLHAPVRPRGVALAALTAAVMLSVGVSAFAQQTPPAAAPKAKEAPKAAPKAPVPAKQPAPTAQKQPAAPAQPPPQIYNPHSRAKPRTSKCS